MQREKKAKTIYRNEPYDYYAAATHTHIFFRDFSVTISFYCHTTALSWTFQVPICSKKETFSADEAERRKNRTLSQHQFNDFLIGQY